MSDNSRRFRDALGHFATGVAIATARDKGGAVLGLTINSFASVSLEPPLVLWSLDRSSDRFEAFMQADRFALSVLGDHDRRLSHRLSRKGDVELPARDLRESPHGVPALKAAIAEFYCRVEQRYDGGDHVILVGRVLDFAHAAHASPLIFYRGRYRGLADDS